MNIPTSEKTWDEITLDRVAMATNTTPCSGCVVNWCKSSGSKQQTSPLLPENKHFESQPRTPIVRRKLSSNTDPPLSLHNANVGESVN